MKILNGAEQVLFDRPPQLSSAERRRVFELPVTIWSAASIVCTPLPRSAGMQGGMIKPIFDPVFRRQVLTLLGDEVLAMYRTARQIDPVKLVVVDLDDTLERMARHPLAAEDGDAAELLNSSS